MFNPDEFRILGRERDDNDQVWVWVAYGDRAVRVPLGAFSLNAQERIKIDSTLTAGVMTLPLDSIGYRSVALLFPDD